MLFFQTQSKRAGMATASAVRNRVGILNLEGDEKYRETSRDK
jgi:hypothetical protein